MFFIFGSLRYFSILFTLLLFYYIWGGPLDAVTRSLPLSLGAFLTLNLLCKHWLFGAESLYSGKKPELVLTTGRMALILSLIFTVVFGFFKLASTLDQGMEIRGMLTAEILILSMNAVLIYLSYYVVSYHEQLNEKAQTYLNQPFTTQLKLRLKNAHWIAIVLLLAIISIAIISIAIKKLS